MNERICLLHDYRERQHLSMQLYAERLGEALERQGLTVDRVRPPDVLPAAWQRLRLLDKVDSYLGRFAVYPRLARTLRADVFHIIDHGQAFLIQSLDAARTVVTCHDLILLVLASGRLGSRRKAPVATEVLRHSVAAMRRARLIVAVSDQTRRDLAALAGVDPSAVEVVPSGLNFSFQPDSALRAGLRRRLGAGADPLVLHVGVTDFYKNVEGCLRVIARLRAGGIAARLVRVGPRLTPAQSALKEKLGLSGVVHELGPLGGEALAETYAGADVLLFPSLYEGFGWPPLEAMASGTPVVSSRGGALPEVVGDAALTAEPEDTDGLAAQVAAVLGDATLAAELRRRGLARAALFTWDRTAQTMSALYQRIAS